MASAKIETKLIIETAPKLAPVVHLRLEERADGTVWGCASGATIVLSGHDHDGRVDYVLIDGVWTLLGSVDGK